MIIARPIGGLANQMSVYAAGRMLAEHHAVPLKIDLSGMNGYELRDYELDKLSIKAEIATDEEIRAVCRESKSQFVERLKDKIRKKFHIHMHVYREWLLAYDSDFLTLPNDIYVGGSFPSVQYYHPVRQLLQDEFQVSFPLSEATRGWETRMHNCNSVSLHIRRGDYANNPKTRSYHGLLDLGYYRKAIEHIEQSVTSPEFFIFSDDLEWVRDNLNSESVMHVVDANGPEDGYQDYHLMQNCKHHIIANSGFSRWPAYLNDYSEKIVCMPKEWFQRDFPQIDAGPLEWVRIENSSHT